LHTVVLGTTLCLVSDETLYEFIEQASFERSANGLLDDAGLCAVQELLRANPRAGTVEQGTRGIRKLRVPLTGRGKRGGARVIYYFIERKSKIYLLLVYPKNEKASLTKAEKAALQRLTQKLEGE
jgi:hypothetical protein